MAKMLKGIFGISENNAIPFITEGMRAGGSVGSIGAIMTGTYIRTIYATYLSFEDFFVQYLGCPNTWVAIMNYLEGSEIATENIELILQNCIKLYNEYLTSHVDKCALSF